MASNYVQNQNSIPLSNKCEEVIYSQVNDENNQSSEKTLNSDMQVINPHNISNNYREKYISILYYLLNVF